jgi:hypothetical protein
MSARHKKELGSLIEKIERKIDVGLAHFKDWEMKHSTVAKNLDVEYKKNVHRMFLMNSKHKRYP